jgi:outer membrane lipoprotein-sorting protein
MIHSISFSSVLKVLFSVILLFLGVIGVVAQSETQIAQKTGFDIAQLMFEQTPRIDSAIFTIRKKERIEGELITQESFTKFVKNPFQVYIKQTAPNKGQEVLYVQGENNDKAIINPNGFPWINLKLQPLEGIMRNNQHHTIFQSGFDHVVSILAFLCEKYKKEVETIVINNGDVVIDGRDCYSITFNNPHYEVIDYKIGKGETTMTIAQKFMLNEHMILSLNSSLNGGEVIEEGRLIKIPNDYSPKMDLFIDKEYLLPVNMLVYDNDGLYEQYEYFDIHLTPDFGVDEFSQEYTDYGF